MKHLALRLLPVALLAGVAALSASTAQPDPTDTEVRAIIDRALERLLAQLEATPPPALSRVEHAP